MSNIQIDKFVYILHGIIFSDQPKASADPFIICVSLQDNTVYKTACEKMLSELRTIHGEPKPIEKDDDLDDPKVFTNQQVVAAFQVYKNIDKVENGPDQGKLKHSWLDRFRRIENIYEKLRSEPKHQSMCGSYYYITKQKLQR